MKRSTSSSDGGTNDVASAAITKAAIVTALAETPVSGAHAEASKKGTPMEIVVTEAVIHQLTGRDKEFNYTRCGQTLDAASMMVTGWHSHVTCPNCLFRCTLCEDTGIIDRGCPYCVGPEADYHTMCIDDEDIPCECQNGDENG
jgi:hypothetical protein